jgi:hypothetical protein
LAYDDGYCVEFAAERLSSLGLIDLQSPDILLAQVGELDRPVTDADGIASGTRPLLDHGGRLVEGVTAI